MPKRDVSDAQKSDFEAATPAEESKPKAKTWAKHDIGSELTEMAMKRISSSAVIPMDKIILTNFPKNAGHAKMEDTGGKNTPKKAALSEQITLTQESNDVTQKDIISKKESHYEKNTAEIRNLMSLFDINSPVPNQRRFFAQRMEMEERERTVVRCFQPNYI